MVGDSTGLRQEADAAKQAFSSLSQQAGGLQSKLDMAGEDQKSFVESQISSLRDSIMAAGAEVNRTSAEYSGSVAQERADELMKEVKEDEKLIAQKEKEDAEKAENEKEVSFKKEKPEVHNEDLVFLGGFGIDKGSDPVDFSNSTAGANKSAKDDPAIAKKEETGTKAVSASTSANT